MQSIFDAPLVQILSEENINDKIIIINYGITFLSTVISSDLEEEEDTTNESLQIVRVDLVRFRICEVLMPILTRTGILSLGVRDVLYIFNFINKRPEDIPRFITVGLPQVLVQICRALIINFTWELTEVLNTINSINKYPKNIPRFVTTGLP
jgi:hypothetical protein